MADTLTESYPFLPLARTPRAPSRSLRRPYASTHPPAASRGSCPQARAAGPGQSPRRASPSQTSARCIGTLPSGAWTRTSTTPCATVPARPSKRRRCWASAWVRSSASPVVGRRRLLPSLSLLLLRRLERGWRSWRGAASEEGMGGAGGLLDVFKHTGLVYHRLLALMIVRYLH